MKYLVNGAEVDLNTLKEPAEMTSLHDRLLVRTKDGTSSALVVHHGDKTWISYKGQVFEIEKAHRKKQSKQPPQGTFLAAMPGQIVDVLVKVGMKVPAGQKLVILEAMKTQQPIIAPCEARVLKIAVNIGDQVKEGDLLVHLEPITK